MDSTSATSSRFRFRDHDQQLADEQEDDDSSQGHTSADSSSVSAYQDDGDEPDLLSMTAKGVQYLCSELVELKQESDEEFHKDIFSNYSAFIAILREIEGMKLEIFGLEKMASSQKNLIQGVMDRISLRILSEDTIDPVLEEQDIPAQPSFPSTLESHTENVADILDTFLSEHRLDDALALLEMEGAFYQNLRSEESFSYEQLMSYKSTISEKKAMLSKRFILTAKHPRVRAPELQKALSGLCQLGDNNLATELLIHYYHSRIASGIRDLQFTNQVLDVSYLQGVAKYIFSTISQAAKSFVSLNGGTYSYPSKVIQWAGEELEVFSACFIKYIESISEVSSRLSITVKAARIAISYCCLLETQKMFLQPILMVHIRPCIEDVLHTHIDHLKEVIGIVTSTDNWVLGRYFVSGILTGRNYAVIDQLPECYFLTNSGRKFVTLIQSVAEDTSPLITMQMESSVLKGLMDLFRAYIVILKRALHGDTEMMQQEEVSKINLPESLTQQAAILVNLSTLVQFSASIIRNIFDGFPQLDVEIGKHQSTYVRLKTRFLETFVSDIFSSSTGDDYGRESSINWKEDSTIYDLIPSVPYLELYLELKKLQKLVDDDCIDNGQLNSFIKEIMEAALMWVSNKSQPQMIGSENLHDRRVEFLQLALDTQFLIEIARSGGYLTDLMIDLSSRIISGLEGPFISAGLNPLRDSDDDEWPANAAVVALVKLQELQESESQEYDSASAIRELNQSAQQTDNLQGENNAALKLEESSLQLTHNPVYESRSSDGSLYTALAEDAVDMDAFEQDGLFMTGSCT